MTKTKRANGANEEVCPEFESNVNSASNPAKIEKMNDALIRGEEHPEMLELINKSFVAMTGQIFGTDDRRNTKNGDWNRVELPLSTWLYGWKKGTELLNGTIAGQDFGLTRWKRTKRKGGDMIVLADAINGAKTDGAIKAQYGVGLDVDNQTKLPFALEALEAHNLFGFVYPTFRHMTTELELDHDAVVEKLGLTESPNLTDVKQYLRGHHKDRYADEFIDAVEISEICRQTSKKQVTVLKTPPQHKFRIFLFLSEPVELASLGTTLRERKVAWGSAVQGVADMLGVEIDPSTKDINRGFFVPQLPSDSEHQMYIVQGRPLHFGEIPKPSKSDSAEKRGNRSKRRPDIVTEDGTNISNLYDMYGKRWMLAEISEHSGLETSANVTNSGGKIHVRCPFADGHTDSADDGATFAMNAEDSHTGFAVVDCQHGSCKSANQGGKRHVVEYLGAWIDDGVLDPAILENPEFMVPMPDGEQEEKFFQLTPDETKGQAEARAYLRNNLETVDGETRVSKRAIKEAVTLLEGMGVSPADALDRVSDAVSDVKRQLSNRATDRERDPVAEARREVQGKAPVPHVLDSLHDDKLVDDDGFILKPDAAPELYRSYGIDTNGDSAFKLMQLEIRDQMFRNMTARFSYVVLDGEAKVAIRQQQGDSIKLWKEPTMGKLYVNRAASYWGGTDTSPKVVKIEPAKVFLYARQRATFFDTCFEPDPAKAKIAARRGAYNLWNGFAVQPKQGDWSLLRTHIKDNLCSGNEKIFNFVMTWLASLFSRPGVKVPSSIAVIGEQGVGKSKVFDWIRRAIGAASLKVSAGRHLTGNFNAHLDGLIFLVCEEAFWGGDKQAAGVMKDLISSETLQIEGKFANLVERPNYVNLVFVSNNKWSVPVDGEDARRFLVLECSDAQKQNAKYFGAIDDQMENGGLEAMVHELMHWNPVDVDMTWHDLRRPPATDSLRQQVGMGLNGPAELLVSVLESGVLSGRTRDGEVFYYDLLDDEAVDVSRLHLVTALETVKGRGNLTGEMKDAIAKFLGEDADHGNNKKQIEYHGDYKPGEDVRQERVTSSRIRYITIPALSTLGIKLARYGRGLSPQ